jgi:hypothetical protein
VLADSWEKPGRVVPFCGSAHRAPARQSRHRLAEAQQAGRSGCAVGCSGLQSRFQFVAARPRARRAKRWRRNQRIPDAVCRSEASWGTKVRFAAQRWVAAELSKALWKCLRKLLILRSASPRFFWGMSRPSGAARRRTFQVQFRGAFRPAIPSSRSLRVSSRPSRDPAVAASVRRAPAAGACRRCSRV